MTANRPLVLGIGNEFRNDDSFGLVVAEKLRASPPDALGFDVVAHHGEGTGLMALWQGRDCVVAIDAVSSNGEPGALHLIDAAKDPLPPDWSLFSSHAFGLAQAIELSRDLGSLPAIFWVVGGEGKDFSQGQVLSPQLFSTVDKAVESVMKIVSRAA